MYRKGLEYDEMAKKVIDIYLDYNIKTFPINVNQVCQKMQIALIPYSSYQSPSRELLKKESMSSFYVKPTISNPATILYNDDIGEVGSLGNIRRNIMHEVKHYVCDDTQDNPDDDLADYFGKYFLAPIPYLIVKGIDNCNDIMSIFGVDDEMSSFIYKNIRNRKKKQNNLVFHVGNYDRKHRRFDRWSFGCGIFSSKRRVATCHNSRCLRRVFNSLLLCVKA